MISLGLTGFPLSHSLSPRIHEKALSYCGLEGQYTLFPVPPDDEPALENLVGRVRSGQITGLNVTIPHKQRIMPILDRLSSAARAIGAVNAIYMKDSQVIGDNTDAPAFLDDLYNLMDSENGEWMMDKNALVLGAGGAARAVVYALLNNAWKVSVAARREQQAQELLSHFQAFHEDLSSIDFSADGIRRVVEGIALIVNTTPLGMSPNVDQNPWPQEIPLPNTAVCYDLVYNPRETRFIRQAREASLRADSGLGMLVRQAKLAFKIWTGHSVPVDQLMPAVEAV